MTVDHMKPRVVITGIGAVSPLGSSVELLWDGWINGRSGVRRITQFDATELPCQIAGEIPDFDPGKYFTKKDARRIPRSGQISVAAAVQAVKDSGLPETMPEPERSGVVFGTTIGGLDFLEDGLHTLNTKGFKRVNPFALPMGIPNLSAFLIANRFQCLGRNFTVTTACATGTQAIGEGYELIRRGDADVVISGGTESLIRNFTIGGFSAMRAVPFNYNENPEAASRPFDSKREGFVFSEGAAAVVLEKLDHALARDAPIHAEIIGYASSSDGYTLAALDPDGLGPARAMRWALDSAHISPDEINYINAHGSSTQVNDMVETKAIKIVFSEHAYNVPISSTKSMLGHAMGASGALEVIACLLTIKNHIIPPTINYEYPDPECDLDYVPNCARKHTVNTTLSNSFGLGGQNACLILRRFTKTQI